MKNNTQVKIEISNNEALVLFEFLSRFSESKRLSINDDSEKKVLEDLLCLLEIQLIKPFKNDYAILLKKAQNEILHIDD